MNLTNILKHIEDLYNPEEVTEEQIESWVKKYPERVEVWEKGLSRYNEYEIIQAIDEYWRFKDNKIKPKLAHIQAILNTQKGDVMIKEDDSEERKKLAIIAEKTKEELRKKMIERWGVND